MAFPPPNSATWSADYFGCFDHCETCLCGCCFPCVLVGRIVEIVDQGATSCGSGCMIYCCLQALTGLGCLYTCGYRSRLRQKYGLPAVPCNDLCSDCCCPCCSLTQQYRELLFRGIDPALGYAANQHKYEVAPGYAGPPQAQLMQKF